jgi:putative ABC transport system permease protein
METLLQDLRYALRTLARQPGFTTIAVFTLAVGIGANTAIYSVVDATLLRTLPFHDPDRLMKISLIAPGSHGEPTRDDVVWSYPKYETFRQSQQVFADSAVYRPTMSNLTGTDEPEQIRGEIVGASYFPLLGIKPVAGRSFLPEEDVIPEKDMVAMISRGLWERRYGADAAAIGKTISLDLKSYTIVGVVPAGFQGLSGPADVWLPAHVLKGPDDLEQRQSHSWEMVARLKPGVSVDQARSAVTLLGPRIEEANALRNTMKGWGAKARTLSDTRLEPAIRKSVLVLFGAVSFVLLIACVNIANLLLARGSTRSREIAIRLAIGANRRRLVRQLLTESLLLAMLGAVASVALAWVGVHALDLINPANPNTVGNAFGRRLAGMSALGLSSIRLDSRALLFTFGVALLTGILFGLAPALQGSRADVADALKSGGARPVGLAGIRILTGKSILVVTEVALAVVLLIAAGLMIKSFARLIATRTGVDPDHVLTVRINLPGAGRTPGALAFFSQLETRVAALPGVVSAGLMSCHALAGGCSGTIIWFRDRPPVPQGSEPPVGVLAASPSYFKTMKIPLLRGRGFTAADRQDAPKVVLINDTAARRFWPGEDPIGQHIGIGMNNFDRAEVIGIVGDVRYGQMDEPAKPDVYIAHQQSLRGSLILYARTSGNPAALTQAVRQEVRALNRDLPIFDIKTMPERIAAATARARFSAILLAIFAGIALSLSAVGIYGVMSYVVTQRTREIGIRMALGARQADVLWLVLGRGLALAAVGTVGGVGGALAATRVLETMLYEVKPGDPETYLSIAGVLLVVASAASYIPARRAAWVEPSSALRAE